MTDVKVYALYGPGENVLGAWSNPAYIPRIGDTVLVGEDSTPLVVGNVRVWWPKYSPGLEVVDLIMKRPVELMQDARNNS